ncbi:hypothetical protein CcaverHIS002_0509340 [Cutaneotrichosporon cavernicola]|uniref:GST C-terminal domain-containing protein n=1 Tax=Cutaneotrichosporon cavernicola TaxID=279322 RepID=A0AA48QXI3_9TREE|nr:uncharacterized protein CcaverHIS019_0509900 [Cutaneotrichosporon cavernicola]BEI85533.1 hypothetical protein CcaverHIS002_0509340 [Cutaneotrichosporon cavernicola]BEI93362.1 hypothetical protein CcaverHIS019_0509900 [Cutaneotrichosporon cavernicola]BEJ01141.1 hypothetical protein CcaverHIS631_0509980 [Cutaneotrichosporon cavernicola]BEJ08909.1 hypothetical protein CcaverHIS641_0510030 [Cutaneotrichosporon cavernicola]
MSSAVVVHTTPPLNPLPASDAVSIRLLGILRLGGVSPGVTTADWSANGKPFITLDNIAIQERYLSSIPGWSDPDHALSAEQAADVVEWKAYVDGLVTDLINHTMYSLPPNYPFLAGAQIAACPFPMNHYVPHRLRSIHRNRLRVTGLWGLGGGEDVDDTDAQRKKLEDSVVVAPGGTQTQRAWSGFRSGREVAERQRKFGEEALRQHAYAAFDPLARKLGESRYFYGNKPTSFDIALFAQLTLALSVSWPNPLIADLLRGKYPTLIAHHDRVLKKLYPGGWSSISRQAPVMGPSFVSSVRLYLPSWLGGPSEEKKKDPEVDDPRDIDTKKRLQRGRYLWFVGAGAAFISYIIYSGLLQIQFSDDDDDEEWGEGWIVDDEDSDPFASLVDDDEEE